MVRFVVKVVRFCKGVWRYVKGKVGLIRFVSKVVGLQIKCLLELNCVCPVPFNLVRAFVALGSQVVEGTKIRIPSRGCYEKYLMRKVAGLEPKESESPVELLFMMDTTWPQGAAAVRWNRITSSLPKFLQNSYIVSSNYSCLIIFLCTQTVSSISSN